MVPKLIHILSWLPVSYSFIPYISTNEHTTCRILNSWESTRIQRHHFQKSSIRSTRLNLSENPNYSKGGERTLYDILEINPSSTRAEIKKQYFKLAKTLHPDAQISSNWNSQGTDSAGIAISNPTNNDDRFSEVSIAYKILSDPLERKRYDRALQAEAFTEDVEKAATKLGEQTAMYGKNLFENVAAPLLRRTSATTSAFINAASADLSTQAKSSRSRSTPSLDFSRTVKSAFEATVRAGKKIDRLELDEKSKILDKRSKKEQLEALQIENDIDYLYRARLVLSLKIPEAPLSADEALLVLESFNTTDSLTFMESVFSKHTCHHDIELYKFVETEFNRKVQLLNLLEQQYVQTENLYAEAERQEQEALNKVEEYTRLLAEAKQRAVETKNERVECSKNLTAVDLAQKRSRGEVEKLELSVRKKRDVVKEALMRKEDEMFLEREKQSRALNDGIVKDGESKEGINPETSSERVLINGQPVSKLSPSIENFFLLKNKENLLREERLQKENRAARLISRSRKLKERSDFLNDFED